MMRAILAALALCSTGITASAQTRPLFVGEWSGGPATCAEPFRFSATTYTPTGGERLKIAQTERDGRNYLLSFADGYRVALFDVTSRRMTWHSPISGDTFELVRCR